MRFSAYILSLCFLGLLALYLPRAYGSSTNAVIADVTTHLPPPHKAAVTNGCNMVPASKCPTIVVSNLAADGTWIPNAAATVTVNAPQGMTGFLVYAAVANGKHVGTFAVTQGTAQNADAQTPPGSTLQHSSAAVQNTLVATWTAPPPAPQQMAVTFTALVLHNATQGNIVKMTVQQNANQVAPTKAPATTAKPTAAPAKTTTTTAAAAPVVNCFITVPNNALTAAGLATPYILSTDNTGNTPCTMANTGSQAFVQGAIIDPATGKISVYNPLVITTGTQPAVKPTAPTLPAGAVVATWFGFNGNSLTLKNAPGTKSVQNANCVNGVQNSVFTQFAYCNAPNFFNAVQNAVENGLIVTSVNQAAVVAAGITPGLVVPPLGTAIDGAQCPTLRNFFFVDMDQSDNLGVQYLVTANGLTAQNTAANRAALAKQTPTTAINPGDNPLLTTLVNPAIKCAPGLMAPDLADNNNPVTALPLQELQAMLLEGFPQARVPSLDPMVLVNAATSVTKLNNFRLGVMQVPVNNIAQANTACYCKNMARVAPIRFNNTKIFNALSNSASFVAGQNLFAFMVTRFQMAVGAGGLNCAQFGINTAAFAIANPVFKKVSIGHTDSAEEAIEQAAFRPEHESLYEWHQVPNSRYSRVHVLDAANDTTTIVADWGLIADYQNLDMTSSLENMDHNNALGLEMEAYADLANLAIADPGTQNADPATDDTPFIQTATGLGVVIGGGAAVILLVAGISAFVCLRKRKHHTNTVSTMSMSKV